MPAEQFANLAETTLASGYTSGTTTLSVASSSGFPTVGPFRVRLGNAGKTIWRVDSVSGTTWTGAAEANDANASSSDTVKIVASRQAAERMLQSPSAGEIHAYAGVSGADRYGPIYKMVPIVGADFAWIGQGGATVTDANGISFLSAPGSATNAARIRKKTAPAPTYTVTAAVIPILPNIASADAAILFRESATGKLETLRIRQEGTMALFIHVSTWTNETSPIANVLTQQVHQIATPTFLRISYDGTNMTYSYSFDGINFVSLGSRAKATFFTTAPDEIGYHVNIASSGGTQPMRASFISWVQS